MPNRTQAARERAAYLAARRGMCLFVRGREVWAYRADGTAERVCRFRGVGDVWESAVTALTTPERAAYVPWGERLRGAWHLVAHFVRGRVLGWVG